MQLPKLSQLRNLSLGLLAAGSLLLPASQAEAAASAEITQMTDDVTSLTDLAKTVVLPVAGIIIAFSGGALIVKRVIYS